MFCLAVILLIFPSITHAATKYWIGSAGGSFSSDSNWSTTSGGSNDTTAPGSSDVATFDGGDVDNATIDANINVSGIDINTGYTGTITQNTGITVTVGSGNYDQADGTFTGGDSTIDINGTFTLSGGTFTSTSGTIDVYGGGTFFNQSGGTFSHNNGTVIFRHAGSGNSTGTIDVDTSLTLNNVEVTSGTGGSNNDNIAIASGDSITVNGSLTHTANSLSGTGVWNLKGNLIIASTAGSSSSAFNAIKFSGTGDQTYSLGGGSTGGFEIDKTSGTVTPTGASNDLAITNLTLTNGSFTAPSGTLTINFGGSGTTVFSVASGTTFTHNSGTILFSNGGAGAQTHTIDVPTSLTIGGLTINSTEYTVIASGDTLVLTGGFTQTMGRLSGGTVQVQGDVTIGTSAGAGSTMLQFTGTSNQTYTDNGGNEPDGDITINKPSGTVTLASNADWNATNQDLTITDGTLDLAGYTLATGTLTVTDTLQLQGGETVTTSSTTFQSGSTAIYNGTGSYLTSLAAGNSYHHLTFNGQGGVWEPDGAVTVGGNLTITNGTFDTDGQDLTVTGTFSNSDTLRLQGGETVSITNDTDSGTVQYDGSSSYTGLPAGNSYNNLTFNNESGTWTLDAALDVDGNLTISSGTLNSGGNAITLQGNFTNGGTYTHANNTFTLDGTNQTITGANTFYNLTKNVTSDSTLTFPASATTTVTNTMNLQGTAGNLLSLRSSTTGTQWSIDPQGTRTIAYLDVQDSNNTNTTRITTTGLNITDSGNNTGWAFNPNAPSNFSSSKQTNTTITWTWTDNSSDETGFKLYNADTNALIKTITTQDTTSYTETGLTKNTTYRRYVTAYNAAGISPASNTVEITTKGALPNEFDLISPNNYATVTTGLPTFSFYKSVNNDDAISTYTLYIDSNITLSGIPSSGTTNPYTGSSYIARYYNENDGITDNDYIEVTLQNSGINQLPLDDGTHTWYVKATDIGSNRQVFGHKNVLRKRIRHVSSNHRQ